MKVTAIVIAAVAIVTLQLSTETSAYSTGRFQRVKQAPYPTPGYPDGPSFTLPGEYGPANPSEPSTTTKPTEAATEIVTQPPTEPATEPASEPATEPPTEPPTATEVVTEEAVPPTTVQPEEIGGTTEETVATTEEESATTTEEVGVTTEDGTVVLSGEEEAMAPESGSSTKTEEGAAVPGEGQEQTPVTVTPEGYPVYVPVVGESEEGDHTEVTLVESADGEAVARGDTSDYGAYYIYHPSGLLQRVVYSTKEDAQNMGYTAQLSYQHVEQIQNPIFTYDPETYVFRELQFSS